MKKMAAAVIAMIVAVIVVIRLRRPVNETSDLIDVPYKLEPDPRLYLYV